MVQHSERFKKLVNEVKQDIKETDIESIKQKLENNDSFYLVDVREQNEWERGHLPKAIHIGKGVIERDIEKIIPDTNAEIVLYCGGGYRSALAALNIQKMGYTNVLSMDGGFRSWYLANYSIE